MAMERSLQEVLERLSAGQEEMKEAAAPQEKANAEMKANQAEMEARAEARH
jgi:hypothetical protein